MSQEDGHTGRSVEKREGEDGELEGVVVNATPAPVPVPLCDRVKALSASVN